MHRVLCETLHTKVGVQQKRQALAGVRNGERLHESTQASLFGIPRTTLKRRVTNVITVAIEDKKVPDSKRPVFSAGLVNYVVTGNGKLVLWLHN
jgi:hypothetical protein